MAQFKALDPRVEVNGDTVLAIVEGMRAVRKLSLQILAAHGIVNPRPDEWYLQQNWLDSFQEIAQKVGPATLKAIGARIPHTALWPAGVHTIADAMASIDVAYHMNHRNGPIGNYTFRMTGDTSGLMLCTNPYPCEFDLGIIEATAAKFAAEGTWALVKHDDSQPCRKRGGDSCTYLITWQA